MTRTETGLLVGHVDLKRNDMGKHDFKTIEIGGETFMFHETFHNIYYGDPVLYTQFFKKFTPIYVRKYLFFGPKQLWRNRPNELFRIYAWVTDEKNTKTEISDMIHESYNKYKENVEKEKQLENRAAEIKNGE